MLANIPYILSHHNLDSQDVVFLHLSFLPLIQPFASKHPWKVLDFMLDIFCSKIHNYLRYQNSHVQQHTFSASYFLVFYL